MTAERKPVEQFRVKSVFKGEQGLLRQYKALILGDQSWWALIKFEFITTLFGWVPGALGLGLRALFFPLLFKKTGKKVVFGRDLTLRAPHKIAIGDRVIIDDNVLLDGKGAGNQGLQIGNDVYIGQGSILQTKDGDIILEDRVNISYLTTLASTNRLQIGARTFIGPYCLIQSGGEHDYETEELDLGRSLPLEIGQECWIGAHSVVLQDCHIGQHVVVGAGSIVTRPIPADSIALGSPARVVRSIARSG
jgi:acetyltransferase-like isoleucine patch superfamily enzyme